MILNLPLRILKLQAAKALGFTMLELSDIQAAFDHYDRDHDGTLLSGELIQALAPLLLRMPEEQQLKKLIPLLEEEDEETLVVVAAKRNRSVCSIGIDS